MHVLDFILFIKGKHLFNSICDLNEKINLFI